MNTEELSRLEPILGEESLKKLKNSHVAVFGLGGVGGHVCEALARCGIGKLDIFDCDTVSPSNLNRQIIALHSTVGRKKTDVLKERLLDIDPELEVNAYDVFYSAENADQYPLNHYDYIADAIDSVPSKLELIRRATEDGIPIISSMGTGNKLDLTKLQISDISKTEYCPLAKKIRISLRKMGISHLPVVFSTEDPIKTGLSVPASTAFVPAAAGLLMASKIIRDIAGK